MKQLKVRVWDTRHIEDGSQTFLIRDLLYMDAPFSIDNMDCKIVDEFTGLLDKRGVEIYEGDVVRRTDNNEIGKVIFVNGCFVFENDEFEYLMSLAELNHNDFGYFVEVIGNIYENPDLLED